MFQMLATGARPAKKKTSARKADSNVFTVSVGDYVRPDNPHPNKARVSCNNCKAVMTAFSSFTGKLYLIIKI